jgi:uncharacterized protein YdhG (YjbR/CyaY superfamily)
MTYARLRVYKVLDGFRASQRRTVADMKRAKSMKASAGGVEAVEEFLASVPEPARTTLLRVREIIRSAAPADAREEMGYGVPAFRGKGLLAGYAAGKKFCSYYPMSGRVITKLADDLKAYETTSGSIHFDVDKPLPAALIRKLVKARMAEIDASK